MGGERDADGRLCLDVDTRRRVEHRINRLAGQVEGIRGMIAEERGCEEIVTQIASIRQAANGLAGELLQARLRAARRAGHHTWVAQHLTDPKVRGAASLMTIRALTRMPTGV